MPPMETIAASPLVEAPRPMTAGWRRWGRALALVAAVTFALTTILSALDALNITTAAISIPDDTPLPQRMEAIFQNQSARFPWIFVASLAAIVSFAALAALGLVVRRYVGARDPRGSVVVGAFAIGGLLGIAGELAFIAGQAVVSNPQVCQCEFGDPQLIARGEVLSLVNSMQMWMVWGLLIFFAIGLVAAAATNEETAPSSRAWLAMSRWLGVVMVLVAILFVGLPPLADAMRWDIDAGTISGVLSLVVLLVLVPAWALWLRRLLAAEPGG
jgi:hypothetical protein